MVLHENDNVEMILSEKPCNIGKVKKVEIIETKTLPINIQEEVKSPSAYKVGYVVTLPGLQLPERMQGKIKSENSKHYLAIKPYTKMEFAYPKKYFKIHCNRTFKAFRFHGFAVQSKDTL